MKLHMWWPYKPAIADVEHLSQKNENLGSHKNIYKNMHSSFIYKRYYNKPRCALPSYRLNSNTHIYTTSTLLYFSVVKREKLLIHTICISHQITEGKKLIHSLHTVWFQLSNCWSDKFFFFNGGQISGFQQLRQEIRGSWVCLIKGKHERSQWCWNSSASWLWWWIHKPKQMIKLYRTHTHTHTHAHMT